MIVEARNSVALYHKHSEQVCSTGSWTLSHQNRVWTKHKNELGTRAAKSHLDASRMLRVVITLKPIYGGGGRLGVGVGRIPFETETAELPATL